MGCLCTKERIKISGRTFYVRDCLGHGYEIYLCTIIKSQVNSLFFYRGFSTVDLIEDASSHQLYALKRITCHSTEDQRIAMSEVEYGRLLGSHNGIIEVHDCDLKNKTDGLGNELTEVLILLPFYRVRFLASNVPSRHHH